MDVEAAPPVEPGWYADATGSWWWWDGGAWRVGPIPSAAVAAAEAEASRDRSNAVVVWVLGLLAGLIGVAVMFAVAKERTLARQHATEALNLAIVLLILTVPILALSLAGMGWWLANQADEVEGPFASGSLAGVWALGAGLSLLQLPLTAYSWFVHIKGLMAASRGDTFRAPLPFRLVSGTSPEDVRGP